MPAIQWLSQETDLTVWVNTGGVSSMLVLGSSWEELTQVEKQASEFP